MSTTSHTAFPLALVKEQIAQFPLLELSHLKINGQLVVVASDEIKFRFERTYIRGDGQELTYTSEMPAAILRGLHDSINELYPLWIAAEAKMAAERANKAGAEAQKMHAEALKWAHPPPAKRGRKALVKPESNDENSDVIVD